MKSMSRISSTSDAPIEYLYRQGVRWEELRMEYWRARGNTEQVHAAVAAAAHYEAKWHALPETAHRSVMPSYFR